MLDPLREKRLTAALLDLQRPKGLEAPPKADLDQLQSVPGILAKIKNLWGTQQLDLYLSDLLLDVNAQFSPEVGSTIFQLLELNQACFQRIDLNLSTEIDWRK